MMFLAGIAVTIVRPAGFDAYGDPAGEPERIPLAGVGLAPRVGGPGTASNDIERRGREAVRAGLTMYAEADVDVRRTDLIEVTAPGFEGTYKVDGEPSVWVSPFDGWQAGAEIALLRQEG